MNLSRHVLLVCCNLILAGTLPALADIKGPNGEKCDSTKTKVEHTIKNVKYICDQCTFSKCDAAGKEINKCTVTNHWTNCAEKK
jgi:hypothetical protein